MVAIIHENGWCVSKESQFDIYFNGIERYGTLVVTNIYQAQGILKEGDEVECYTSHRQITGVVQKIGIVTTTIRIVGETLGLENKLKDIINGN